MSQHDIMAKLLIIGNSGVGKTNVLLKFTANTFVLSHITTIGIDFKSKIILVDGKKIRLQIWDTAGQQRFKTITQTYYKGAEGIILAYSVDDEASFQSLENWIKQIKQHAPQGILIFLIGTKCDISKDDRKVSCKQGQEFARQQGLTLFEVSSKSNTNIENLFQHIGKEVKSKVQKKQRQFCSELQKSDNINVKILKESQLKPTKHEQCKC